MYLVWIGLAAFIGFIVGGAFSLAFAVPRFIERAECDGFCFDNVGYVFWASVAVGAITAVAAGWLVRNNLRRKLDSSR